MSTRPLDEPALWTRTLLWVLVFVLFAAPTLKVYHDHIAHGTDAGHPHGPHRHAACELGDTEQKDPEQQDHESRDDESKDTHAECALCLALASLGHGGPFPPTSLRVPDASCVDRYHPPVTRYLTRDPHALAQPRAPPVA